MNRKSTLWSNLFFSGQRKYRRSGRGKNLLGRYVGNPAFQLRFLSLSASSLRVMRSRPMVYIVCHPWRTEQSTHTRSQDCIPHRAAPSSPQIRPRPLPSVPSSTDVMLIKSRLISSVLAAVALAISGQGAVVRLDNAVGY